MKTFITILKTALCYLMIGYWMLLPNGSFSQILASETSESEEEYTPPLEKEKTSKKKGYYYLTMGSATTVLLVGCIMAQKSRDNTVTEAPSSSTFTIEDQIEASHDNSLDENKARDVPSYNNFGNQGLVEKSRGSSSAPRS